MSFEVFPSSWSFIVSQVAPIDSATTTLFDSTVAFGVDVMRHLPFARISIGFNNSHAFTLNAAESTDKGVTWRVFSATAVGVPAANTISGPYDFLVDIYHEVRFQIVNGGTTQTTWEVICRGHENRQPGV